MGDCNAHGQNNPPVWNLLMGRQQCNEDGGN